MIIDEWIIITHNWIFQRNFGDLVVIPPSPPQIARIWKKEGSSEGTLRLREKQDKGENEILEKARLMGKVFRIRERGLAMKYEQITKTGGWLERCLDSCDTLLGTLSVTRIYNDNTQCGKNQNGASEPQLEIFYTDFQVFQWVGSFRIKIRDTGREYKEAISG